MTKPTKWVCTQRRLRSAWASAQSDQSLLSPWRKLGSLATHWAISEDSDEAGRTPRLIRVFNGCTATLLVLLCRGSTLEEQARQVVFAQVKIQPRRKSTINAHPPSLISVFVICSIPIDSISKKSRLASFCSYMNNPGYKMSPSVWLVKNHSTVRCICCRWTLYPKINFQPIRSCFNAQANSQTCIALLSVIWASSWDFGT